MKKKETRILSYKALLSIGNKMQTRLVTKVLNVNLADYWDN